MVRNIFFDVVIDLEDTVRLGDQVVSTYMYRVKHSNARNTIVSLDKNFVKIMFRDGEIVLRFRDSLDMLRFAKALYDAVIDMFIDDDFRIARRLGTFLRSSTKKLEVNP